MSLTGGSIFLTSTTTQRRRSHSDAGVDRRRSRSSRRHYDPSGSGSSSGGSSAEANPIPPPPPPARGHHTHTTTTTTTTDYTTSNGRSSALGLEGGLRDEALYRSPPSTTAADLLDHRRKLLEVGRADVDGLLRDISEKYSQAIYQRDVDITHLRRRVATLEAEAEEARAALRGSEEQRQRLEGTVSALSAEAAAAASAMASLRTSHEAAEGARAAEAAAHTAAVAKLEERAAARREGHKAAGAKHAAEVERLNNAIAAAKAEAEAKAALAKEEKRRSDHYFAALKHSESEAAEALRRMERLSAKEATREHSREWLEESLRLQLLTTRRLLGVLSYIGHSEDGPRCAKAIGRCVHALGSGQFQYVEAASLHRRGGREGGGGAYSVDPTAPATVLQDLQQAISSYAEAEAGMARRYLPMPHASSLGASSAEPFRSLHVEKDRWVPSEAVAVVRYFQQRHFPNARPDLFYGLLLQVSTVLRDLCGLSPTDALLRRLEEAEAEALRRYGLHNNALNAPFDLAENQRRLRKGGGGRGGASAEEVERAKNLDFAKQSFPRHTASFYYSERAGRGNNGEGLSSLSAADEVRLAAVAEAVEGLLLLRRNIAPAAIDLPPMYTGGAAATCVDVGGGLFGTAHSATATKAAKGAAARRGDSSSHTGVTLAPSTCEEVCGAAIAALEEAAAAIRRGGGGGRGGGGASSSSLPLGGDGGSGRLAAALAAMGALFSASQDSSSRQLQMLRGVSGACGHLRDALRTVVADVEKGRRAAATAGPVGIGVTHGAASYDDISVSGPYAVLKAHASQAVERYTREVETLCAAAEGAALSGREAATRAYHEGLARADVKALGPRDVFIHQ